MSDEQLTARVADLGRRLDDCPGLMVAFSGGADSAFLLAAAVRRLGPDRVVAATAVSDSLAEAERGPAADFTASLGVEHLWLRTDEMSREGYRANAGDRCYFCKAELTEVLAAPAAERGWPVATGTNADDVVAGFRPGIRAATERGALTPLADAGLTKDEIREQSRRWELPTWDKPAAACLSSRIAYGLRITPARLARVEAAETAVRAGWQARIPITDLRVRDLGDRGARVELDAAALAAVATSGDAIVRAVEACGFDTVELASFRSGSLNDALRRDAS